MNRQLELDFNTPQDITNEVTEKCIICKEKDQEADSFYCQECWPKYQAELEEKIKIRESLKKPY